jgi:hypothetical protein
MRILASRTWYAESESRNESQPNRLAQQTHGRASTALDLYLQAIDESKLAVERDMALRIYGRTRTCGEKWQRG